MKKVSLLLAVIMIFTAMSVYAEVYNYPGAISPDDPAYMEPYFISSNVQRYSPWFKLYSFQTKAEQESGKYAGEGGQIIMSLEMSPVNENNMMLGSDMSQAYRSTNGGIFWECLDSIYTWAVGDIKWHPSNENMVYIIQTSRDDLNKSKSSALDGLYVSYDAGKSFEQILDKTVLMTTGGENFIHFDEKEHLYVLTSEGIYKSKSKGLLWECLTELPEADKYVWGMDISHDGKYIAAAYDGGIYYSKDFGVTWTLLPAPEGLTAATCVLFNPEDYSQMFAIYSGTYTDKVYSGGLFVTTDEGKNWEKITYDHNKNGTNKPRFIEFGAKKADGTRIMYMVFDLMHCPIRISDDYGKTWRSVNSINNQNMFTQTWGYYAEGLAVSENDPLKAYFSFGDIVYQTLDGGKTWNPFCSGYSVNNTNNFVWGPDGRMWFAFVDKGIGVSDEVYGNGVYPTARMLYSDAGIAHGTSGNILINPQNPNDMLSNLGNWSTGDYVRSLDGGKTWTYLTDSQGNRINGAIGQGAYYPEKNIIYTGSYTSYDNGETWQKNERNFIVSPVDKNVIYSTGEREVFRSDDGGKTFVKIGEPISSIKGCMADVHDAKTFWVGCYDGTIVKFEDTKRTTFNEGNGLSKWGDVMYTITTIGQDPKNKDHLVAGGKCTYQGLKSPGLYETWDGGKTWEIVPGMPGTKIFTSLVFSPVSDEIFIGTCSNGTFIYEYENYKKYKAGTLDLNSFEPLFEIEEKYTDGKIRVKINGNSVAFDVDPFTVNDRTMVPMRKIFEVLGAEVTWEDATQTVGATLGDTKISLSIGSDKAYVNGAEKTLDAPAMLKDSRTLVPLRFVSESLGCKVEWDGENNLVKITK